LTRWPRRSCPALTTERLTLAAHEADDFPDMLEMWRDPVVVKYFGGVPSTSQECWARLLRYGGLWPLVGHGYWRIRERGSGRFVGEIGFAEFRRDMTPSLVGAPEAGWVLASWAHGMGYAGEAMRAALAWTDTVLGADRTVCMIDPENAASLALAARLGFRLYAETLYAGRAVVLLERLAAAPEAARILDEKRST